MRWALRVMSARARCSWTRARSSKRRRAPPSSTRRRRSAPGASCSSSRDDGEGQGRRLMMGAAKVLGAFALAAAFGLMASAGAEAQQTQLGLYEVTKSKKLRVCQFPLYYSISYRNPKTGEIEGIDADLSKELAKELGAELEIVESSFGTFIADLQANKCEIGMFGVGASLKRAQAVEFSKPYLITNVYGVTRKGGRIKSWADVDKKGVKAAVSL